MSYDTGIVMKCCGVRVRDVGNMTSNVSGMWELALGGRTLSSLHGLGCDEALPLLNAAISHMAAPENGVEYAKMEPRNGWGSAETAIKYLRDIRAACEDYGAKGKLEFLT